MKHFLKNSFKFAAFIVVSYLAFLLIWGTAIIPKYLKPNHLYPLGNGAHLYTRLNEAKNSNNVDILFLGSSHTYRGFDNRIFEKAGYSSFNMGSSSQTPAQTLVLLNRYLESLHPKLILYEVYPATFCMDGVEASIDLLSNDQNDWESVKMAIKMNNIKTYNTLFYGLLRNALKMDRSFQEDSTIKEDTYVSGGYVEREMKQYSPSNFPKQAWEFNENHFKDFELILKKIQEQHIPIILINAPIANCQYASYTNNDYFDSLMNTYGEYYNFNGKAEFDDSLHFSDSHHLNQLGVEIFDSMVIELIQSKYLQSKK